MSVARKRQAERTMSHADLSESLARHVEAMDSRLVWVGVGIGSRWLQRGSIPIPDVFSMQKSYTRPDLTAYEVKVHLGNLKGDIREGKYRRYFEISNRLFFAYRSGMAKADEIPAECGIITYNPTKDSWSVQRAAPRRECNLGQLEWQSLLFALQERRSRLRCLSDRLIQEQNATLLERARELGYDIQEKLRRVSGGDEREAAELMAAAREVLGEQTSIYEVKRLLLSLRSFARNREIAAKAISALDVLLAGDDSKWARSKLAEFEAAVEMEAEQA